MKRLSLSLLTALAVLATGSLAQAQRSTNPAAPSSIGLIDMAYVFQKYEKFVDMRDALQAKIAQSDEQAKKMVQEIQRLQQQLAEAKKEFNASSPQVEQLEKQILDAQGQFQSFKKSTQLKLAREESDMLRTIYSDVSSMVNKYARYREYTMVLRFNRKDISADMQPQEAIQLMNKNVIYHQTANDITDPVLAQLNKEYNKSGRVPARQASDRRTVE